MAKRPKSILEQVNMPSSADIEQAGFVAEPIFEVGETPVHEPELHIAAHALDPANVEPPSDLVAKLYKLSEQERQQLVYGVVEMENSVSDVATGYGVEPEVVLLAIRMAALEKANGEGL
jgi:hypothetical protein